MILETSKVKKGPWGPKSLQRDRGRPYKCDSLGVVKSAITLEKLLFEAEGYKTLVATRYFSTISRTTFSHLFNCHYLMMLKLCPFSTFGPLGRDQFQVRT